MVGSVGQSGGGVETVRVSPVRPVRPVRPVPPPREDTSGVRDGPVSRVTSRVSRPASRLASRSVLFINRRNRLSFLRSVRRSSSPSPPSKMSSSGQVLKSIGPKLVPFFKSVSVYFVLLAEQPSLLTACFKCLPIICLIGFVLLHGISLSKEYTFSRRILTGLVFSCIGDAFLVWPSCFIPGMGFFALAQIMYIYAFGFVPLNITVGTVLYAMSSLVIYALMPGLNGILTIGVPVYTLLLTTMAWRAISRMQFYRFWSWTRLSSCIGGICFLISDAILGFHYFHTPLPYSQVSIMLTYYAAQLGIALSAVDSKNNNNTITSSSSSSSSNNNNDGVSNNNNNNKNSSEAVAKG